MPTPNHATPWDALETIRGLNALRHTWEAATGSSYHAFKTLCLEESPTLATAIPCPRDCGCFHTIIHRHDRTAAIALCRCHPPKCPDIDVTLPEITPLEVNRSRLARALSNALQCRPKILNLKLPETFQFGSWSTDQVPVILTMQTDPYMFRSVIAELIARLRRFVLFAPTTDHVDADCQELLASSQCAFFALDSSLVLLDNGTLSAHMPLSALMLAHAQKAQCSAGSSPPPRPRYAISKGLRIWEIIFDGQQADIRHERGMLYVAYLLLNPPETPIHAIDLAAKIPEIYRTQLSLPPLVDPITGKPSSVQSHARLQERSLALDDAQAMRALFRKERELEAILDSDESEPVKQEALRELETMAEFQRRHSHSKRDSARRVTDSVRAAIRRLHRNLKKATDLHGNPHPVLRQFAAHLEKYLINPSGGSSPSSPAASRLTYQPPPDLTWSKKGSS